MVEGQGHRNVVLAALQAEIGVTGQDWGWLCRFTARGCGFLTVSGWRPPSAGHTAPHYHVTAWAGPAPCARGAVPTALEVGKAGPPPSSRPDPCPRGLPTGLLRASEHGWLSASKLNALSRYSPLPALSSPALLLRDRHVVGEVGVDAPVCPAGTPLPALGTNPRPAHPSLSCPFKGWFSDHQSEEGQVGW